jgi:hypothetical protein
MEMSIDNNFQWYVFAEDGEDGEGEEDSEVEEDSAGNVPEEEGEKENEVKREEIPQEVKKKHVQSIVDSFLKINKNIDHTRKRKHSKKLQANEEGDDDEEEGEEGEEGEGEGEDSNETKGNDDKKSSKKLSKKVKEKHKNEKQEKEKQRKGKRGKIRREKTSPLRRVYTVKKVSPFSRGRLNYSGGGNTEYTIKSYGNSTVGAAKADNTSDDVGTNNKIHTVKDVNVRQDTSLLSSQLESPKTSSCLSSDGCHKT